MVNSGGRGICKTKSHDVYLKARYTETSSGCWEWKLKAQASGYGLVNPQKYIGTKRMPHQVAYLVWKGPITKGLCVCHSCDNRMCINPDHLFLGTHKENTQDMWKKGRSNNVAPPPQPGGANHTAKLNEFQVRVIKKLKNIVPQVLMADIFGVKSHGTIGRILRGEGWQHA